MTWTRSNVSLGVNDIDLTFRLLCIIIVYFAAPQLFPTEVMVHSDTSDSVKVTFRGVSTQAGEEPLQGYKV